MVNLITCYELEVLADGTYRIGNSVELTEAEARLQIQSKVAKHESCPIGVLPDFLDQIKEAASGGSGIDKE